MMIQSTPNISFFLTILTFGDWDWLHHNVGWIHVRFPISGRRNQQAKDIPTSWHIDGGHYTPHYIDSPEQSVIVLPMIQDVRVGGGNTLLLSKSHIYMAQKLAQAGTDGIPREKTQNANDVAQFWPEHWIVEMAPCEAGDVFLLRPFLVHAAGQAHEGHPLRIAFNMGVKWKRKPIIDVHVHVDVEEDTSEQHPIGWLEKI